MAVREPAVAGMFYPAGADQLRHDIAALLQNAPAASGPSPKVLILPHAGYVYSGGVAATACKLLRTHREGIRRVALFRPAHRVYLEGMAVPATDAFATPLGTVPLDRKLIVDIATLPVMSVSDNAHQDEHRLDMQLTFLQTALHLFTLVPV